ncbi:hypothetical protein J005_05004 [Cryptococcus neoformans]|nr:hypothetical protein J005_05004 [Cryptococcus neoformans var. grubii]
MELAPFHHASPSLASSALADAGDVYRKLDILGCDWETAVAVHIDDLHASCTSDYGIPSDAHVHIPYLSRPDKRSLDDSLDAWADKCGAAVVDDLADVDGKRLVKLSIAKGESIPSLASPSILLITGSRSSSKPEKRQERPFPTYTSTSSLTTRPTPSSPKHNSTIPTDAPLFDRVQILTTPIITALLVTFGLFIPLAAFGISALASIQVPPRMMEIGKGLVVGKERKDQ